MNDKLFQKIAEQVEKEFECGGLSSGLYYEYAKECAARYCEYQSFGSDINEYINKLIDDIEYAKTQITVDKVNALVGLMGGEIEFNVGDSVEVVCVYLTLMSIKNMLGFRS